MENNDILKFQVHRRFISIGKNFMNILEKNHQYIKELENVLVQMGINVEKYSDSPFDYKKDRSSILGEINDSSRECQSLIDAFKVELKKD